MAIVPGIDGQKMSKSYNNTIPIFGKEKEIRKAIMNIVTDCKGLEEPKDPDHCNVVALYKLVATPEELEEMKERYRAGGYGYGHAKMALFEKLWNYFEPMRKRRAEHRGKRNRALRIVDQPRRNRGGLDADEGPEAKEHALSGSGSVALAGDVPVGHVDFRIKPKPAEGRRADHGDQHRDEPEGRQLADEGAPEEVEQRSRRPKHEDDDDEAQGAED